MLIRTLRRRLRRRFARRQLNRYCDSLSVAHEKIGTDYGGWVIPVSLLSEKSLCYGVGAGEDISFEVGLIKQFGCEVHCFDPTPRAQAHVARVLENTRRGVPTLINNTAGLWYDMDVRVLDRLHFYPYGIWSENRTMRFYSPADPTHVSHSIVNLQGTEKFFEGECRTIRSLMESLRHQGLTLLKLDVEGAEYEILRSLLDDHIQPQVLCIEFDEGYRPMDDGYMARILSRVERLKAEGYFLTHIDGWNVTLIHESTLQGH
jgi:FkbM family methyltransferase